MGVWSCSQAYPEPGTTGMLRLIVLTPSVQFICRSRWESSDQQPLIVPVRGRHVERGRRRALHGAEATTAVMCRPAVKAYAKCSGLTCRLCCRPPGRRGLKRTGLAVMAWTNPSTQGQLEDRCRRMRVGSRRSEEHTSELQSQSNLVCRLLLEKT